MPDAVGLVKIIKRTAMEAVDAANPVAVFFGKVTSTGPLKINVEQKMTLGEAQLVLTRNVTDYTQTIPAEPFQDSNPERKGITIHNGLVVGDEVILVRMQGGQKFIVMDRIGK